MIDAASRLDQMNLLDSLCGDVASATFSPCRQYRYTLTRTWSTQDKPWMFLMLNPSTADEVVNDPTVSRCQARAKSAGAGGLIVTNIFAWRSTDPQALYGHQDPVGPDNDRAILEMATQAGRVICAWGNHGELAGRGEAVRTMLLGAGCTPYVLALNKGGSPKHPLYVSNKTQASPWLDASVCNEQEGMKQ